jgi:hypothetical protein
MNQSKKIKKIEVPLRYIPRNLSLRDKISQRKMLNKSRKLYKKGIYFSRKKLPSFTSKKSKHILHAEKIYNISSVQPNNELAMKTGCSLNSLKKIVNKGEGAYFSSGSRPNQTGKSWGIARLASAITSGKAAAVDYNILVNGCKKNSKALQLANKAREKYGYGKHGVPRVSL